MTDPVDAALAATRAPVSITIFDTIIPAKPVGGKWGAFYPDLGAVENTRLCGPGDAVTVRWQVSVWAAAREDAAFQARKIRDALTSGWITAAGWQPAAVDHELSVQARPDEDVQSLVVCTDRYSALFTKET